MRNFTLSDTAASELWTALNNSSGAPAPQPAPTPASAPTAPPAAPQTELERIIGGAQYKPEDVGFPNGWPPRDPNQSPVIHKATDYIHTDSKGGGFYTFPGFAQRSEKPLPHDNPTKFSAADRMTMQYIQSSGKDTKAAYAALYDHLKPIDVAELGQMFGSSGSALLYNPYAGSMMAALANGLSVAEAKASLALIAQTETSDGSKESIVQLDDAWFAQAVQTVAKFA